MRSGDAMPIWIWSKVSGLAIGFAKWVSSFISSSSQSLLQRAWGGQSGGTGRARPSISFGGQLLLIVAVGVDHRVQLNVEAERAHFLDEHVEALRNARFERIVALDDRLVHLGTTDHVVGLHGQHLLQRVGGAI